MSPGYVHSVAELKAFVNRDACAETASFQGYRLGNSVKFNFCVRKETAHKP